MPRAALCLLALCLAATPARAQAAAAPFHVVAFGDMPYCLPTAPQDCAAEEGRIARLIGAIDAARPAFPIFAGDTKGGGDVCSDAKPLGPFAWTSLSAAPPVYTPGDHAWTDGRQDRGGRHDPLGRLALLRSRVFREAVRLGRRQMPLIRQADVGPAHRAFVENARWTHGGEPFAALHLVGSNNNRPTLPEERPAIRPPAGARAVVPAFQADIVSARRCGG